MSRTLFVESPTPAGSLIRERIGSDGDLRPAQDQWSVSTIGTVSGGTFGLVIPSVTLGGITAPGGTVTVNWNDSAVLLLPKLQAVCNAGGLLNVTCTGTALPTGTLVIGFQGTLVGPQSPSLGANSLTGSGSPTPTLTETQKASTEARPSATGVQTNIAVQLGDLPLVVFSNLSPQAAVAAYRTQFGLGLGTGIPFTVYT